MLIKRQFIVGASTDLFKLIPCRLFDEVSRWKIIDFLISKKLLVKGNWFCDANGNLMAGYMKGSPADPNVSISLANFGLDVEEYKCSINPSHDTKRVIDGKLVNHFYLYTSLLQIHIKNDLWFSSNLDIDEKFVYMASQLSHTTSSYRKLLFYSKCFVFISTSKPLEVDRFQEQQKQKIQKAVTKKRKVTEELQKETEGICGTNIAIKRKRKPKTFED